jgi:multidrug efflux system membrane fusion protein
MFARIRFPIGQPHSALLVIDRALGSDQGLKYLYVVGPDDTVEYRRVETGALQEDGLRVISSGLKPTDRVIVGGILQAKPKMKIRPDPTPMPTLGPASDTESKPGEAAKPTGGEKSTGSGNPAATASPPKSAEPPAKSSEPSTSGVTNGPSLTRPDASKSSAPESGNPPR